MKIDLIKGNCLEKMDELISRGIQVDSIITDIPYGTTSCHWDIVIPFDEMWSRINKLIKKNCPIILFGSQPFTSKLINSNIENFKEEVIWLKNKGGSGLQAKQKHIKIHENIVVFCNENKYTYNPQKWEVKEKEFLTQRKTMSDYGMGNNIYAGVTKKRKPDDGTRNPISIVPFRTPITPSKSKIYDKSVDIRMHPTQKSILLMEYLVKTYSNENETILDFTMGSASTGIACINTNRNFIGIELDDTYFEIASNRINTYINENNLENAVVNVSQ